MHKIPSIWNTSIRSGWRRPRLLALSSNTKQIFVPNSSEYVQFDDPGAVADAIREVYNQARRP